MSGSRAYKYVAIFAAALFFTVLYSNTTATFFGSKHDFSPSGDTAGQGFGISDEKCNACHIPHNAGPGEPLLWNHAITAAAFDVYSSNTLNAVVMEPDGTSKLCLSCHDGTVAVDAFGNNAGTTSITGAALIGNDLSDDHPVSFVYDTALAAADGDLYNPAATASGLGGTIQNDLLFNNKVQCTSCHNAHDDSNGYFLRFTNDGSTLCRTCHIK